MFGVVLPPITWHGTVVFSMLQRIILLKLFSEQLLNGLLNKYSTVCKVAKIYYMLPCMY